MGMNKKRVTKVWIDSPSESPASFYPGSTLQLIASDYHVIAVHCSSVLYDETDGSPLDVTTVFHLFFPGPWGSLAHFLFLPSFLILPAAGRSDIVNFPSLEQNQRKRSGLSEESVCEGPKKLWVNITCAEASYVFRRSLAHRPTKLSFFFLTVVLHSDKNAPLLLHLTEAIRKLRVRKTIHFFGQFRGALSTCR